MALPTICKCRRLALRSLRADQMGAREAYWPGMYSSSEVGVRIRFYAGRYAWQRWFKDRAPGEPSRRHRRASGWLRAI